MFGNGNPFFEDHPGLGSLFDFDRDGSMDPGEGAAMLAAANMFWEEAESADGEPTKERESEEKPYWGSADRSSYRSDETLYDRNELDEDEVDFEDAQEAVESAVEGMLDPDDLVENALHAGTRFTPEQVIRLSGCISDEALMANLIATSSPLMTQDDADQLDPQWGGVEIDYHEDAWDVEWADEDGYHLNTPEEDWE